MVTARQRVEALVGGDACSVTSVPLVSPAAKPSRLNWMYDVALLAMKVSLPVKAACTRRIVSAALSTLPVPLTSMKTIQPEFQSVLPVRQPVPFCETQALMVRPSRMASARANCRSPSSALLSEAMRFAVLT